MLARRLHLYLLLEFVPLYVVGLVTILMLLMIDFFAFLAASFINYHTPIDVMFRALVDRMPFFLSYMIAPVWRLRYWLAWDDSPKIRN